MALFVSSVSSVPLLRYRLPVPVRPEMHDRVDYDEASPSNLGASGYATRFMPSSSSPPPHVLRDCACDFRTWQPWQPVHKNENPGEDAERRPPWYLKERLDKPASVWVQLVETVPQLNMARAQAAALRQEQQRGRHVRAKRAEAIEDNVVEAERTLMYIQRQLGMRAEDASEVAAILALEDATRDAAGLLLKLGSRFDFPPDVWRLVIRFVLPLQTYGYAAAPERGGGDQLEIVLLPVQG